ncbi:AraC family transcriptional regulator [Paenibacillus rhizovicinus]|uniref:AraC family transcriptional regulator n=1 Tax=Paenibacillus rhizovicinus TaxID=2704463 RepID=A0A6C0NYF9_9BACL|nr:AraC family transcriptional regulator [Paenibacillus rhizovicinus]QHW30976.1 AraC family transcriptional regulator [Paenibacillus rhizovicinus]
MKLTYRTIIQNYFHRFQAEVSMAAYSSTPPGNHTYLTPEIYRIWLIQEGEGLLTFGGRTMEMKPGQLMLVPPSAFPALEAHVDVAVSLYWCHFRAPIGDMEVFDLLQLPICVVPKDEEQERMKLLFEQLLAAFRSTQLTRELRIRASMFELLACFLEYGGIDESTLNAIEPLEKVDRVLEYIEEHLSEAIAIEDLARLVYLHPNYFIGYFKSIVGYAPAQYVNIRRLELARTLLEDQELSITDVARKVGMQNHYFSRIFKQHIGVTPSRYRHIFHSAPKGVEGTEGSV